MKIIMYGAEICADCVEAKAYLLNRPDIELDYKNITESTKIMKEFLSYRDHEEDIFKPIKEEGFIGIPFFILEDGRKTLDLSEVMDIDISELKPAVNACSIDGRGNC